MCSPPLGLEWDRDIFACTLLSMLANSLVNLWVLDNILILLL